MYVAIINLIVLATFAASAFLVAAPLTQSQTDPGYVPPSTVESFSQQAQNIDSSALSGTDSQKQEDKPQECLNSYPLYNAYSVEAMQEKALDKASGGKRKCFELRYKPDSKPTTDSQALQDAGNQINSTGNCTYGVCTGDAPSNYSNQNYDSAYDTPTNNTPSAFEAFSQQAQNIDPNALQQNGYFSEGAAPNAYFQGPEAQQDSYTTNADGTYTLHNSDPRREELYRAAETIADYEANKGLLGSLKESLVGEPDYVTEARRIVALNTVEPAKTVPVQVVDKDGNSKIINLPGDLKVDGSPYTLGQQYAAAQKVNPLMNPVLGNAEGLAAKIDQYSNIKGIALTDTNGNTAEIAGVTSFSKVITAMQQEPQEFANVKQVNLAPGDTSIPPTPPPQTPVTVSMAQPTDAFKTTEIASRPLSDSFPTYSAPSNDVPLNVAGNSGTQGAQTGANQGGAAQPPVQTADVGRPSPESPLTQSLPKPFSALIPKNNQPIPTSPQPTPTGGQAVPTSPAPTPSGIQPSGGSGPAPQQPQQPSPLETFFAVLNDLFNPLPRPAVAEPSSCRGNNCGGHKYNGVAMDVIKSVIDANNGKVGSTRPRNETYATYGSLADWLAADVIKRQAYIVQGVDGVSRDTMRKMDEVWCKSDADHNCYSGQRLAALEMAGLNQNDLDKKIDPQDIETLMKFGIATACAEYSQCDPNFISEAVKEQAKKILNDPKTAEILASSGLKPFTGSSQLPAQQAAAQQAAQKVAELADQMAKAVDGKTDSLNKGLADAAKQAAEQMSRAGSGGITPSQAEQIAKELAQAAEDTAKKLGEGGNEIAKELAQSLAKEAENAAQALTGPSKAGGPTGGSGNKALDEHLKEKKPVKFGNPSTDKPDVDPKSAAKLPASQRDQLKTYGADGKSQGTFKDYMAAEQARAQAAVDNDARAKQLDSKFGSGHQVSGTGQSRPVTRNGQPAGTIENMTKEQAALAAAAQARGIKPVFKDGKLFDNKGRQLELVPTNKPNPVQDQFRQIAKAAGGTPQIPGAGQTTYWKPLDNIPPDKFKYLVIHQSHGGRGSGANTARDQARQGNSSKGTAWWFLQGKGPLLSRPESSTTGHIGINKPPQCRGSCYNGNSIGIEVESMIGQSLSPDDEQKFLSWVRWAQERYNIPPENVVFHGKGHHKNEGLELWQKVQQMNYRPGTGGTTYQLVATSPDGTQTLVGDPIAGHDLPAKDVTVYVDANQNRTELPSINAGTVTVVPAVNAAGELDLAYKYTSPVPERDTRTTQPERRTPWQNVKAGWQRFTGQQPYQGPATGSRPMTPGGTRPMTPSSRPMTPSPSMPLTPSTPKPTATTPTASLACFPDPVVATGETQYVRAIWSCSGAVSSIGGTKEQGLSATLNTGGALAGVGDITLTPAFLTATSTSNKLTFGVACRAASGQTVTKTCSVDLLKPELVLVATPKVATPGESVNLRWNSFKLSTSSKDYPCTVFGPDETVVAEGTGSGEVTLSPLTRSSEFILMCDSDGGPVFKSTTVMVEDDTAAPEKVDLPYVTIDATTGLIRPTKAYTPLPDDLCHPYLGTKKYTACVTTNET